MTGTSPVTPTHSSIGVVGAMTGLVPVMFPYLDAYCSVNVHLTQKCRDDPRGRPAPIRHIKLDGALLGVLHQTRRTLIMPTLIKEDYESCARRSFSLFTKRTGSSNCSPVLRTD